MKLIEVKVLVTVVLLIAIALLLGVYDNDENNSPTAPPFMDTSLYIDESNALSINQILKDETSLQWRHLDEDVTKLNLGYSPYVHWLKIQFNDLPQYARYLYLDYSLLDDIGFYQVNGNELKKELLTGDRLPFSSRSFNSDDFVFSLDNVTEKTTVFLQVSSEGLLKIPLSMNTVDQIISKTQSTSLMMGSYIGFMLFAVIGCLIVFLITENRSFIFYGTYFVFSFLSGLNFNGLLFHWVWPNNPELNKYAINIFFYALAYAQLLFVEEYLKPFSSRNKNILSFSKVLVLSFLSFSLAPGVYSTVSFLSFFFAVYINILSIYLSIVSYQKKKKNRNKELYFVFAWIVHFFAMSILVCDVFNVVHFSNNVNNYLIAAYDIQIVLLIAAIVDNYEKIRRNSVQESERSVQELEQRQIVERHMLFQATHDSVSLLPKKQILLQNWPTIKGYIPEDRNTDILIIHFEGYYSIVLAFGQEVADILVSGLHDRIKKEVSLNRQFSVVDYDWNNDKAVVLDSLDICLIYVEKENEDVNEQLLALHKRLGEPFKYQGINLDVVLSIGISAFPSSETISSGIRKAQVASREASQRKLDLLQYQHTQGYDPEYTNILLSRFKKALDNDGLSLVFQPQIDISTGKVFGVESLLRWSDEEEGVLSPDMFIPIIEKSSLINDLTDFVIRKSFQFYKNYISEFESPIYLSINLSARNFSDENLFKCISLYLVEYNVDPKYITFELTETTFLSDLEASKKLFNKLLGLGVKLALDDFGTGYSSLVYLKELPFSEVKIDKSFLIEDFHTKQGAGLVKAAIEIGKNLDMLVIAEGVESIELARKLKLYGCDICQGFYFSKPMSDRDFAKWYVDYDMDENIIGS